MKAIIFMVLLCGLIAALLLVPSAAATGLTNARAMGMAGAYMSLAKGYQCPSYNPANLGFASQHMNGFQLFGVGVSVSNNSFSLNDYNSYTGATLDEADKTELLDKIPSDGLKLSADAEVGALSIGMGNMALSFSGIGAVEVNMSRDVAELLLKGNTLADTISLDGTYAEGYGLASANLSYGHDIYKNVDRELSVGTTVRYLHGFGYEEVTELNGHAVTLATGFNGAGSMISRTALGGAGYAVDLGAALKLSKSYTIGATWSNFMSRISWSKDTKEHRYSFSFDTLTAANMGKDSIITKHDTTVDIAAFTTHLPSLLRLGLAKTTGRLQWAVDWEQGFKTGAATSSRPRISTGAELRFIPCIPLRVGYALGGKQGTTYAAGTGLDFKFFYIDLAAANYNAISGSAGKGLNVAVASGFRF